LKGVVEEIEIWYNNGRHWLSIEEGEDVWKKVSAITTTTSNADPDFTKIKKFPTNANNDYNKILSLDDFPDFHAKNIKIVFTKFSGNVLATKLGVTVNDPNNVICPQKCDVETVNANLLKKSPKKSCKKCKKKKYPFGFGW